jgi:hypothetical protein
VELVPLAAGWHFNAVRTHDTCDVSEACLPLGRRWPPI